MVWSVWVVRVLVGWPRRRRVPRARPRVPRSPYRDVFFANPDVVENDYQRLRRH